MNWWEEQFLPEGRRYARPLCTTANTAKMASIRKVESEETVCSCSKKLFASPVPGAIHTCRDWEACERVPSKRPTALCQSMRTFHMPLLLHLHAAMYSGVTLKGKSSRCLTTYMIARTMASSAVKNTHLPVLCCSTAKYAASSPTRAAS